MIWYFWLLICQFFCLSLSDLLAWTSDSSSVHWTCLLLFGKQKIKLNPTWVVLKSPFPFLQLFQCVCEDPHSTRSRTIYLIPIPHYLYDITAVSLSSLSFPVSTLSPCPHLAGFCNSRFATTTQQLFFYFLNLSYYALITAVRTAFIVIVIIQTILTVLEHNSICSCSWSVFSLFPTPLSPLSSLSPIFFFVLLPTQTVDTDGRPPWVQFCQRLISAC